MAIQYISRSRKPRRRTRILSSLVFIAEADESTPLMDIEEDSGYRASYTYEKDRVLTF